MTRGTIRIAIYVADLDVRGGTQKQVLKLAQYLNANAYEVTIFTPCYTSEKTYTEFSRLDIVYLRVKSNDHLVVAKLFGRVFDQFRLFLKSRTYDIVNPHDNRTTLFILLHALLGRSKQVWQINDIDPAFGVGNSKNYRVRFAPFRRFFSKLASSMVDKITVNVSKNADRVKGCLKQDATVVYCGVDFLPKRLTAPKLGQYINVVSTGVVVRFRNYESLIEASALVSRISRKTVRLDIVGDTRYDQGYVAELKQRAAYLNVGINFTGSVSQKELSQFYENAHVFSFVNVDQSWGLAVFEAASMGLPVVLSKSVGAVELLENKLGILVVDPESPEAIAAAILKITEDDDSYKNACNLVTESVKGMSWDTMYSKNIESIFIELLQKA